jgi:hypothetical protein
VLEVCLLSLVVGLFRKGDVRRILDVEVKGLGWFISAPVILLPTVYLAHRNVEIFVKAGPFIFLLSQILILIGLFCNRKRSGVPIIFIGMLLNILVMAANGGSMPVNADLLPDLGLDDLSGWLTDPRVIKHTLAGDQTRLYWLGDVIGTPWPSARVLSLGDLIMMVGLFIMIQKLLVDKKKEG